MNNQNSNTEQKQVITIDLINRYDLIKKAVERIQKDR